MSFSRLRRRIIPLPFVLMRAAFSAVHAGTETLDEDIKSLLQRGGKLSVGSHETAGD